MPPISLGIAKGTKWLRALHAEMFTFGQAHGYMNKEAEHTSVHALAGRLQAGPSGNLELTVPASLIKGVFDALDEPGAEFVVRNNRTEAAIKVMTKDEADKLGGTSHITERGHSYHYTLGPIVALPATGDYEKLWAISIKSDDLEAIRRSYGLGASPQLGFYIPVGCKKKKVTEDNAVSKLAELTKESVYWSDDVSRDLLNGRKYPVSYLTGELGELGTAIKNRDWPNFKEEVGDSAYAAQMLLAQRLGLNLPLIGASGPIDKFYARRAGWHDIFKGRGVPFSNDYLAGGSNLKKPKKIQAALGLAGHQISNDDARALAMKHGGEIEDDWPSTVAPPAPALNKLASLLKMGSNDQSIGAPSGPSNPAPPISLPVHNTTSGMPGPSIPQGTDFNAMYSNFQKANPNSATPQRPATAMPYSPSPDPRIAQQAAAVTQQASNQLNGNVPIPGVVEAPEGKNRDMERMKHFREQAKTNVANLTPGTVADERKTLNDKSDGEAISMVASAMPVAGLASGAVKATLPSIVSNAPKVVNTLAGNTAGTGAGNLWKALNLQGLTKTKALKYGLPLSGAVGTGYTMAPAAYEASKSLVSGGVPSPYPKWMSSVPDIQEAPFSVRTGDQATIRQMGSFALNAAKDTVGHAMYKGLNAFSQSGKSPKRLPGYLPSAQITSAATKFVAGKVAPSLSGFSNSPDYSNIARESQNNRLGLQPGGMAGEIPGVFGLPSFKLNNLAPYISQPLKDAVNTYHTPSPLKVEANPYFLKEVANKVTPNLGEYAYDSMFKARDAANQNSAFYNRLGEVGSSPSSYTDIGRKFATPGVQSKEPQLREFMRTQAKRLGQGISDNLIPPRPIGQKPATMFPQITG